MSVARETLDVGAYGDDEQPGARWATIVGRLLVCSRQMRRALAEQISRWGINDTEFLLLSWCGQAPGGWAPQNDVSRSIGVSPGQASGMVERLRQRGWVTVERGRQDRRKQFIVLASPGRRLLEELLGALQPWASQLDTQISATEQRFAIELFERLARFAPEAPAIRRFDPDRPDGNFGERSSQ